MTETEKETGHWLYVFIKKKTTVYLAINQNYTKILEQNWLSS